MLCFAALLSPPSLHACVRCPRSIWRARSNTERREGASLFQRGWHCVVTPHHFILVLTMHVYCLISLSLSLSLSFCCCAALWLMGLWYVACVYSERHIAYTRTVARCRRAWQSCSDSGGQSGVQRSGCGRVGRHARPRHGSLPPLWRLLMAHGPTRSTKSWLS